MCADGLCSLHVRRGRRGCEPDCGGVAGRGEDGDFDADTLAACSFASHSPDLFVHS